MMKDNNEGFYSSEITGDEIDRANVFNDDRITEDIQIESKLDTCSDNDNKNKLNHKIVYEKGIFELINDKNNVFSKKIDNYNYVDDLEERNHFGNMNRIGKHLLESKGEKCDDAYLDISKSYMYNIVKVTKCPHCSNEHYIKYGSFNGVQRYKCRNCNRTFSNVTNSLWQYSKKQPKLWNIFVRMVFEQRSLRYCAQKLEISLLTAFKWRHKVLHALGDVNKFEQFRGHVHMQATYLAANNKGNYKRNHPNYIKGKDKLFKNEGSDLIEVIGVRSSENKMILLPNSIEKIRCSKRTNEKENHYAKEIGSKISKNIYIKAYTSEVTIRIAVNHDNKLPKSIKIEKGYKNKKLGDRIGAFFSMDDNVESDLIIEKLFYTISKYLKCYLGVSTKYFQQYFNLLVQLITLSEKDIINMMNICKSINIKGKFLKAEDIVDIDIFESKLLYRY